MLIEQAVFTSTQTDRTQGYQLVSRSPGINEDVAQELSVWGPSHDSLWEGAGEPASTNFHQLSNGWYSISRTVLAGAEYSGRAGERVYTHFLLVSPEVFARFANNPFAVLRAATAAGALTVNDENTPVLQPLQLSGRTKAVDLPLVARLAREPGPARLATLLQAALASDRLALSSSVPSEQLIAGLINLLPIECRPAFSFTTGLKPSPARHVRIGTLPTDPANWRGVSRAGITLLNLDETEAPDDLCWEGWPGYVEEVLRSGKLSALASQLEPSRPWLNCDNLERLVEQVRFPARPDAFDGPRPVADEPVCSGADSGVQTQRADRAHGRAAVAASPTTGRVVTEDLATALANQPPEVVEMLERIDDLVFAAIGGDNRALNELDVLWALASSELDEQLVEQSREQYLRCALSIWSECVDGDVTRPERAVAAIDVLCVLFAE